MKQRYALLVDYVLEKERVIHLYTQEIYKNSIKPDFKKGTSPFFEPCSVVRFDSLGEAVKAAKILSFRLASIPETSLDIWTANGEIYVMGYGSELSKSRAPLEMKLQGINDRVENFYKTSKFRGYVSIVPIDTGEYIFSKNARHFPTNQVRFGKPIVTFRSFLKLNVEPENNYNIAEMEKILEKTVREDKYWIED